MKRPLLHLCLTTLMALLGAGCVVTPDASTCTEDRNCFSNEICSARVCVPRPEDDTGNDPDTDAADTPDVDTDAGDTPDADVTPQPTTHTLTIEVTGLGRVSSYPALINCPDDACEATLDAGSTLTLIALPEDGRSFAGWTGDCSDAQSDFELTLIINVDLSCGVTFSVITSSPGCVRPYSNDSAMELNDFSPTFDGGMLAVASTALDSDPKGIIVRLDFEGELYWHLVLPGISSSHLKSVLRTADGDFIAAGETYTTPEARAAWVVRVTGAGEVMWQRTYHFLREGNTTEQSTTHATIGHHTDGNFTLTASAPLSEPTERNAGILIIDGDGEVVSSMGFESVSAYSIRSISSRTTGDTVLVGQTAYDGHAVAMRVHDDGSVAWALTAELESGGQSSLDGAAILHDGTTYLAGYAQDNSADAKPRGLLIKVNPDGSVAWQRLYEGELSTRLASIAILHNNDVVVSGETTDDVGQSKAWWMKVGRDDDTPLDVTGITDELAIILQLRQIRTGNDGLHILGVGMSMSWESNLNRRLMILSLPAFDSLQTCALSYNPTLTSVPGNLQIQALSPTSFAPTYTSSPLEAGPTTPENLNGDIYCGG